MSNAWDNRYANLWPVGARLRFKRKAHLKPCFTYLRDTPVIVLDDVRDFTAQDDGVRQLVYAFAGATRRERTGWALPSQLEPIMDRTPEDGNTATANTRDPVVA